MVGVEVHDSSLLAIRLDETGFVLGRARAALTGDFPADALSVVGRAAEGPPRAISALGVASQNPESEECRAILEALAPRYPDAIRQPVAWPSGTAAAAGEAWIGAGRDVREMVFFAVA